MKVIWDNRDDPAAVQGKNTHTDFNSQLFSTLYHNDITNWQNIAIIEKKLPNCCMLLYKPYYATFLVRTTTTITAQPNHHL